MSADQTFQPTQQNPQEPDLRTLNLNQSLETRKLINCARPGSIVSFDPATQTATVQIAQQNITSVSPLGIKTFQSFSPLLNVPVYVMGGGGMSVTFPIHAGDECLVVFNDREIDNWFLSGGTETVPTTPRVHDLSDGMCFVGFRSMPRVLSGLSTTEAQLRTDNGTTFVGVNATTGAVRVHGANVYEWDVHGYGQKITWTGGNNYTIDNYTIGAIVTTHDHPIAPPGPP